MAAYQPDHIEEIAVLPITEIVTHYYFRFDVMDQPGVLSAIAGVLGDYRISIKSVQQKGRKTNGTVPIVMLTHEALESDVKKALSLIDDLDVLTDKTMMIRVEQGERGPGE